MTKQELMYEIMGRISSFDTPLVFKGALITKLILAENGTRDIERDTVDIDANWTDVNSLSMEHLVGTIEHSIGDLKEIVDVIPTREYGDKQAAGIAIMAKEGGKLISIDISIRPLIACKLYNYNEYSIKGVTVDEVLADKISVISQRHIFRRAKDLYDVFAIVNCVPIQTDKVYSVLDKKQLILGSFDELINRKEDLLHAYDKLRGIKNKPSFEEVYSLVAKFIKPFLEKERQPIKWNTVIRGWEVLEKEKKPSVLENLNEAKTQVKSPTQKKKPTDPER